MQYSVKERMVATLLSKFPKIKQYVKLVYQRLNYIKYKKDYPFRCDYKISKISFENKESFFGYYDKSPISIRNEYIIFQSINHDTKNKPSDKSIELLLYDIKNNIYTKIDDIYSYNWQQGCKLMWIGESKFIYNNYDEINNKYVSKIYNINTKKFTVIDYPIYDIYKDDYALSLNFERLNLLRPDYGYINKKQTTINWNENKGDGIYYIDIKKNSSKLLINIDKVIQLHYKKTMNSAKHKFNHIMISPNGSRFMFLHRWFVGDRKFDSLIVADIDGTNIKCISDDDMVSHCFWNNENEIFGYLRDKKDGDRYFMLDTLTSKKTIIGKDIIDQFGDGHPNISNDNIIFDTYPNKSRMKELYLFNLRNNNLTKLGEFFESFEFYEETRCDLHPRFSYDGKKVFFDSVHEGKRQLYMMDLESGHES